MAGQTPPKMNFCGAGGAFGIFLGWQSRGGAPVGMLMLGQGMAQFQLSIAQKSGIYSDPNLSPNILTCFHQCSLAHEITLVTNDCCCLRSVDYEGTTKLQGDFLVCTGE